MTDQIFTIEDTRRRATQAWQRGRAIADVGPNWHSAAHAVWAQVYAELDAQREAGQNSQELAA